MTALDRPADAAPATCGAATTTHRWTSSLLAIAALWFLACRVPVMYLQPGGQDEDCYAVPGLTILHSGIPRLPHVPARNPESVYYRADEALFSEPPLYFYWQSLFYAVLPHLYGTARLASGIAGLIGLALIYRFAAASTNSSVAALWGTALLSLSRWFYFPALSARPDMLGAVFGFAAILSVLRWQRVNRPVALVWTGVLIGLGGLTHPFALVYAVQVAVWVALASRGWRRLLHPALVALAAIVTACLWLPLILKYPDAFEVQFRNQFLHDAGGGPLERLLMPWESLTYHGGILVEHANLWQFGLTIGSLVVCTVVSLRRRDAPLQRACWLAWSSIYLMCAAVGRHHPVLGYWIYPAGLTFVCVGWLVHGALRRIAGTSRRGRWLACGASAALLVSMVPGGGYRTLFVHLRNWGDVNYNAPRFARRLMESLPPDAVCAVDTQFALDFFAAGRPTLLAQTFPVYFRLDQFEYDYLLVSRYGTDTDIARRLGARLLRIEGLRDDPFACYCAVYAPPSADVREDLVLRTDSHAFAADRLRFRE